MVENIENTMIHILAEYGNTAFLQKVPTPTFDKVRGTKLWKLWYGDSSTDFCVAVMEREYAKAKADNSLMPVFETKLKSLLNSLIEEFDKIS